MSNWDIDISFFKRELPVIAFLFVALIMGFIFIKNIGNLTGPDIQNAHYKASLALATGQSFSNSVDIGYSKVNKVQGSELYFNSGGDCANNALVSAVITQPLISDGMNGCIKDHDSKLSEKPITTTATLQYPPLNYIPQGLALGIGMNLDMEPVQSQTMARVFNLVAYIILVIIAIRITTKGRWLLVLLALLPTSLFLASSMSADGLNIAWSILFISYICRIYQRNKRINRKQMAIIAFLGIGLFLLKIAYVPIVLLMLMLHKKILPTKKKLVLFFGTVLIGVSLYLVWSSNWGSLNAIVDPAANMSTIISNLHKAIAGILINIFYLPFRIFEMNSTLYVVSAIFIILLLLNSLKSMKPYSTNRLFDFVYSYRLQLMSVFAFISSIGLTYAALLLTWTDIGAYGWINIQGFQGRYVLPLLPLLLTLYYLPQMKASSKGMSR